MDYFLLEQDKRISYSPLLTNWYERLDPRNVCAEKASAIADRMIIEIEASQHTRFLDVLSNPFFLVSTLLKQLIAKYEPYLIFKEIILLDKKNQQSQPYFMPILERISCLSQQSELSSARSVLKKGVLDLSKIGNRTIFQIAEVESRQVVIRLDLAESIYRRDLTGLKVSQLETVKAD